MTDIARNPLDRPAAFTALLELDPEGFGKSSDPQTTTTITTFLDDFYQSGATNMYAYCRDWLDARDDQVLKTIRQAEEAKAAEALPPAAEAGVPEDPDKPWQVTAQVCRSADGWQSSRQVPAFTIPRALAYSKQDAQAKAREIINPYREPYDIHMDVTTGYVTPERQPEAERHVMEGDEQQPGAVQEGQAEADAEAWGPRGPSASYADWVAEGQEDPGPGERQLQDRNEPNYQVDSLEPERGE